MATFLKEGTYGCAVSPPLPCEKTKATGDKKLVGKLIKKTNATVEISIAALLKAIPGYKRYFIVQEKDNCSSKNFESGRMALLKKCSVVRTTPNESLVQLLSPYGGITVERYSITPRFDFLGFFRHLLEGVAKLNGQGICHYDLHRGNVVIDAVGTARLIDFGSAFLGDTISDADVKKHFYAFSPSYPPQPPEMSVQNGIHQGLSIAHSIQTTMDQKTIFRTAQGILYNPIHEQKLHLIEFWEQDTVWKGEGWTGFFHTYWRVWDSYAVGVLVTDLLKKCFLQLSFIEDVWKPNQDFLRKVLVGLLEADPRRRFTAQKALDLFS